MPPKKAYNALSLADRNKILQQSASGKSQRRLATDFGVSLGTINNTLKRKQEIMDATAGNMDQERKRIKVGGNEQINTVMKNWFSIARSKDIPISGPLIQEKARMFASELNLPEFKASNGWLQSFNTRNNISCKVISGESNDVNQTTVSNWKDNLTNLTKDYTPDNIFDADETALFFRALPSKSLVAKGDSCHGTKLSKERLTVLIGSNASGTEKLKLLVIGKAAKPRCFKHKDISSFPVDWTHSKKAWMTSHLFINWIEKLNHKMRMQDRKILLFIDNAPSHPTVDLSHIRLVFLPPNCTSEIQPMDQGVIKALKSHYRKRLLHYVIARMESCDSVSELVKAVTVYDAVIWLASAWNAVPESTLQKCFARAGFEVPDFEGFTDDDINMVDPELQPLMDKTAPFVGECATPEDYLNMEDDGATHQGSTDDSWERDLILNNITASNETVDTETEPKEDVPVPCMEYKTSDILNALDILKDYTSSQMNTHALFLLLEENIYSNIANAKSAKKQTTMKDFFKQK